MAQVRKYATGGGTEKKKETPPTLFHWDGIGDYNVEDLEKTYALEIDNVLSQYDLDEEDKRKIKDRAYLTLQEIKSGRMGNRNANGTWINVTPGFESTGMNEKERKKILGLSIGKKKYVKDADFYQNLAYDVLDQMIDKTNIYTPPKDPVVTPASLSDFNFGEDLINYYFYDKKFDPNNWDYTKAKTNIGSRLADFKQKVINSTLSDEDKNNLLGRISQVEAAFQTEDPNDDYYGLTRLMSNPRIWLDKDYLNKQNQSQSNTQTKEEKNNSEKSDLENTNNTQNSSDNPNIQVHFDPKTRTISYGKISNGIFYPQSGRPFALSATWDVNNPNYFTDSNLNTLLDLIETGQYSKESKDFYSNLSSNQNRLNKRAKEWLASYEEPMTLERFLFGTAAEKDKLFNRTYNNRVEKFIHDIPYADIKNPFGIIKFIDNNIGFRKIGKVYKGIYDYLLSEPVKDKKGGKIFKHQQGGITKYQNPAKPIRDVTTKASWIKQIYNTDPYLNWLKSFNTTNYQDFNNYQKGWYNNYLKSAYNPTGTNQKGTIPYSQDVYNSQGVFNKQANGVNLLIEDLAKKGIIGRRGNSGDNLTGNFQDGYFGGQEYLRHGGMESMLTPEQVTQLNTVINPNGLEYYFDPVTKMGYLRPLNNLSGLPKSEEEIPELRGTTQEEIYKELSGKSPNILPELIVDGSNKSGGTGEKAGVDPKPKKTNSNSIDASAAISDLLGLGRLAGTIWTNNRIAKTLKNSLSPLLIDPPQIRRQVMGDLATKTYMENLGAEANRIGSRPITSDASLQLGQALDYNNRANEYRIKGYLADKQAIDKTSLAAQEAAEQNAIARVDAANRNRASMLGIRQAKANIEAQRKSANWSQAVAPWLMDKEYRLRQNNQLLKELDYQEQDYLNRKTLNDTVSEAQDAFNRAKNAYIAAGNDESTWIGSPAYEQALNQLNQAKQKAADIYNQARIKAKKSIYSSPWIMFKSGGKLSYEEKAALEHDKAVNKALLNDSKEFNKIIRESKKENNKLILSLSGLTKELVIKSMTYGG